MIRKKIQVVLEFEIEMTKRNRTIRIDIHVHAYYVHCPIHM